jgi:hypothetical protein
MLSTPKHRRGLLTNTDNCFYTLFVFRGSACCIHPIVTTSLRCCDWVCNTHGVFGCINVMRACLPFPDTAPLRKHDVPLPPIRQPSTLYSFCPTFPNASVWQLETWFILRNICIFGLTDVVHLSDISCKNLMVFLYLHFSSRYYLSLSYGSCMIKITSSANVIALIPKHTASF